MCARDQRTVSACTTRCSGSSSSDDSPVLRPDTASAVCRNTCMVLSKCPLFTYMSTACSLNAFFKHTCTDMGCMCVCVCVCVYASERSSERACMYVHARVRACVCASVYQHIAGALTTRSLWKSPLDSFVNRSVSSNVVCVECVTVSVTVCACE